jgi:hypothetical protein
MLDFILLFILSFAFTRAFEYAKSTTFDVKLYPFYFLLILFYLCLSLSKEYKINFKFNRKKAKMIIFWLIFLITIIKTSYSAINMRHLHGNTYPVHDNPIQIEEAIKYLKQGKNPYAENYLGTPQEDWYETGLNMALWHVVTLPFYLLFSLLLSFPFQALFGYFDQRMVHILVFIIPLYLVQKLTKNVNKKIIFLSLLFFNPFLIHFLIEGRNDIFVFSFIFLSLYLLQLKKFKLSSIILGLAFSSKQSSWLLLPFYFYYIWFQQNKNLSFINKFKAVFNKTWPFFLTVAVFFIPFLVWDGQSFIEDIYLYPGGGMPTSYPISGMGISMFLLRTGVIPSDNSSFPFSLLQITIGIPIMIYLITLLKKNLKISFVVFSYAIFLFIFWILSRFFADNYLGYIITLCITGFLFLENEKTTSRTKK